MHELVASVVFVVVVDVVSFAVEMPGLGSALFDSEKGPGLARAKRGNSMHVSFLCAGSLALQAC